MTPTIDQPLPSAASIDPHELVRLRAEGRALHLIDVRTPGEFETGHIEASYNVPLDLLGEHAEQIAGLDHVVVLVCQSGARATKALEQLVATGSSNLRLLEGGIDAWSGSGGHVVRTNHTRWAMDRQVRLVAGGAVLASIVASIWFPLARYLAGFVGAGLTFSAITNTCGMALGLAKLPYNRGASCDMSAVFDQLTAADDHHPIGSTDMIFNQYYLDCLSHASYLIGDESTGRAVVVDPQRDIAEYLADAEARGLTIELVIETHFHADFLSGHLELAAATGAEIGFSAVAETEFDIRKLADGERISLGEVVLEIRHTPGHTPESMSIVVWEHDGDEVPYGVLTGDTLFIGDVGRPDLLASVGFTRDELADEALRLAPQQADDPARRDTGVPRARRRIGVRQEPVDRAHLDDRRTTADELRPARTRPGDLRRTGHRGPATGSRLLRPRRHPEQQTASVDGRDRATGGD